jgi:hypothetical protein
MSTLLNLAAEHHELAPIIMPPIAFAGIAAAIFVTLAIITHSYRDVANRHADKVGSGADDAHGGHH